MKYDPLILHLENHSGDALTLAFEEIETLLGGLLPASAVRVKL